MERERAEDDDLGAVYVGKASFRMGTTPTQTSAVVGGSGAVGDSDDFFGSDSGGEFSGLMELPSVPRVPTERIVLGPASPQSAASRTAGAKVHDVGTGRRSIMVSFGGAFLVGVVCTVAGQVALHWRARHAGAPSALIEAPPASATPSASAAPSISAAPPTSTASDVAAPPALPGVAAPSSADDVVAPTPAVAPTAVGSGMDRAEGLAVSEARTHSRASRQHAAAPPSKDPGHDGVASPRHAAETATKRPHEQDSRTAWVDPFADEGDASESPDPDRSTFGSRRATSAAREATPRWNDPFAE